MYKNPGVGSHIWENFPKEAFFLDTFPNSSMKKLMAARILINHYEDLSEPIGTKYQLHFANLMYFPINQPFDQPSTILTLQRPALDANVYYFPNPLPPSTGARELRNQSCLGTGEASMGRGTSSLQVRGAPCYIGRSAHPALPVPLQPLPPPHAHLHHGQGIVGDSVKETMLDS